MNYRKNIIYRRIVTLQAFRSAWTCLSVLHSCIDYTKSQDKMYEVTKHYKNQFGAYNSDISFLLSNEGMPKVENMDLFSINIRMLSEQDIKRYIAECNEYGMNCPKYPKL